MANAPLLDRPRSQRDQLHQASVRVDRSDSHPDSDDRVRSAACIRNVCTRTVEHAETYRKCGPVERGFPPGEMEGRDHISRRRGGVGRVAKVRVGDELDQTFSAETWSYGEESSMISILRITSVENSYYLYLNILFLYSIWWLYLFRTRHSCIIGVA
jgi:hypothetical protein